MTVHCWRSMRRGWGEWREGDMGMSYMARAPVSDKVLSGLKVSAILSVVTLDDIPERSLCPRGYWRRCAPVHFLTRS